MQTDSILITLNDTNFHQEVLESDQPVFVEFFAKWCGTCHINSPIIREVALKFQNTIKFCQIDVEAYNDIANAYGVQKIPTMFFFQEGQIMDYMVGIAPKAIITRKLEELVTQSNKGGKQ